jgi:predicted anti-sigma-YlaC factor YlaD
MSCQKYQDALVALARREGDPSDHDQVRAHLDECGSCRRRFDEQEALTAGLRALAEASRHEHPSDALEAHLMASFDEERTRAAAPAAMRPGVWLRWWLAAAAAVLAVLAAAWWQVARTPAPLPAAPFVGVIELTGFQALPQAAALPDFDSGEVVRTEIAVSALPVYGVGIPPDAPAAAVKVDLLVGQDGQPRAIRLVPDESLDSRSR